MTVSSLDNRIVYNGSGSTGPFAFPFKILSSSHLDVKRWVDGVATQLELTTHYTVTGVGEEDGGAITLVTALASGQKLSILPNVPATQTTAYLANDTFPAEAHEAALDKLTIAVAALQEKAARSLGVPEIEAASPALPAAATRAGKMVAFDAEGDGLRWDLPSETFSDLPEAVAAAQAARDAAQTAQEAAEAAAAPALEIFERLDDLEVFETDADARLDGHEARLDAYDALTLGERMTAAEAQLTPAGAVLAFAMNAAPAGWLACSGQTVSRTTYAALFAAIGTTFDTGGEAGTDFRLPDLRGEFVRGWDNSRGLDTGRTFGSAQTDELKAHTHSYQRGAGAGSATGGETPGDLTTVNTGSTGGTETRPRNIALLYCIKV